MNRRGTLPHLSRERRCPWGKNRWLAVLLLALAARAHAEPPLARLGQVEVGQGPASMALGRNLYVCLGEEDALGVVDTVTRALVARIPVGRVPVALALDAASRRAAVACFRSSEIVLVDLERGVPLARRPVPAGPRSVAWLHRLDRVLVASYHGGRVEVLRGRDLTAVASLPTGMGIHRFAVAPDEGHAYLLDTSRDRLLGIDARSLSVESIAQGALGVGLWDLALAPDGRTLVVSGWISNTLAIVDPKWGRVIARVETLGRGAAEVAIAPDGRLALVAHSEDDSVAAVDLVSARLVGRLRVGRFPFSDVAIAPDGRLALVTNDQDGTVSVLGLGPLSELGRVATGRTPRAVIFEPEGLRAYVANTDGGTISVLGPPGRP